jgi:hypothetical protein
MLRFLIDLFVAAPVQSAVESTLSKNLRDDPVYKKNVRKLIERNRKFEETRE